jgi:hypothetical protein
MIDVQLSETIREEIIMSTQAKEKSRNVSFCDDDKVILIPLLTDEEKEELFYDGDDIKRMKEAALREITGVTEEDLSTKGKDLFEVRAFKRESLERVARGMSPIRSPVSQKQPVKPVDLGDTLFPGLADTKDKEEIKPQERERRPRGGERGLRRCKSGLGGPSRTDSLATRTNEGRTLRRGAPSRARSSMGKGAGGAGLSDLAQMRAVTRKIGSSKPAL